MKGKPKIKRHRNINLMFNGELRADGWAMPAR
jgi:hypothetical protein